MAGAYEFLEVDKYVKETKSTMVNINWAVSKAEEYAKQQVEEAKESIRQMLIDDDKEFLAERI